MQQYQAAQDEARRANEQRYQQGLSLFDEIINRYQPGGQYGQGALALYEQGKTQALSQGMQNLVSSGLSNTTIAAGLPIKYEQEVGSPFRLQLEDTRMNALTQAQLGKAGFIENRTDAYPDANLYSQLMSQASSGGGGGTTGGAGGSLSSIFSESSGVGTTSTPRANVGTVYGSEKGREFWQGGVTPAYTPGSSSTTPSMPENEYQTLLQENLARNQKSTVPSGGVPASQQEKAKPTYDEMLKWTSADWTKIYKDRGVYGDPYKMRAVQREMGFLK